jgi:hypothetical protein
LERSAKSSSNSTTFRSLTARRCESIRPVDFEINLDLKPHTVVVVALQLVKSPRATQYIERQLLSPKVNLE